MGRSRQGKRPLYSPTLLCPCQHLSIHSPAGTTHKLVALGAWTRVIPDIRGNTAKTKSRPIAEHVFTTGVPSAGRETLRMNFCVVENYSISEQHEAEIIIENFQYLP